MALIRCPDCGTEVSDLAAACPKCARPIAAKPVTVQPPAPAVAVAAVLPSAGPAHACIHCGSTDLSYGDDKQGFGVGKAFAGYALAGPVGLFAGGINKNKRHTHVRCNSCFKVFRAEQMVQEEQRKISSDATRAANLQNYAESSTAKLVAISVGLAGVAAFFTGSIAVFLATSAGLTWFFVAGRNSARRMRETNRETSGP